MPTPVSIVIPAHNQLEYCRQCVESIRANTDYPYRLILVDNGSTDGVAEYFDSIPNAIVVHSESNLGFPAGSNLGLRRAEGHVLLLNSDTIVPPCWLSRLVSVLESANRIGAVGPMSNNVSGPQHIENLTLNTTNEIQACSDALWQDHARETTDLDRIVGFCMLIKDAAFAQVGLLDESFGLGNFEDDDYCLRLRKAGYRVCMARGCFVFHYGSRTFHGLGATSDSYRALISQNSARFAEKWGIESETDRVQSLAQQAIDTARALRADGDLKNAIAALAESIALNPRNPDAFTELGAILLTLGDADRALAQFRRALAIDPQHAPALRHTRELMNEGG